MVQYPLRCPHPDCNGSQKQFKGFTGIRTHFTFRHGRPLTKKELEEMIGVMDNSKKENLEVKVAEQPNNELDEQIKNLAAKVDTLTGMIPPDFCTQFPNLCALAGKVDALKEEVGSVKQDVSGVHQRLEGIEDHIPAQITVKTEAPPAKPEAPSQPAKKEGEPEKAKVDQPQPDAISQLLTTVDDVSKKVDNILKTKQEPPAGKESDGKPETPKAPQHKETGHRNAKDLLSCPGCRAKILTEMQESIRQNDPVGKALSEALKPILSVLEGDDKGGEEIKPQEGNRPVQHDNAGAQLPDTEPGKSTGSEGTTTGEQEPEAGGEAGTEKSEEVPPAGTEKQEVGKCHFFLRR